jgi:hypothetical protein
MPQQKLPCASFPGGMSLARDALIDFIATTRCHENY